MNHPTHKDFVSLHAVSDTFYRISVSDTFYRIFLLMQYLGVQGDGSSCAHNYGEEALAWLDARHHLIMQGYGYTSKRQ